jgi:hypothetical protein
MGKARIISQIEPGRYQIELDHGTLQRDAMIAEIEALLQGEELALQDADATIAELQNQLDAKVALLNALIDEMNNPPAPEPDDGEEGEDDEEDDTEEVLDISERIGAAIIEVERARRTLNRAERQKANIVMKAASLRLNKANLERVETDKTIEAWCTDGEPDLSGDVGTAEVPGEPLMPILIKPGFEGAAAYDPARDGQMIERPLMSGAQAYLNAALLPGWQRWKPTYRFGAITAIDRDNGTCSIQLEPTRSSAQNLVINPSGLIHGVRAKYQDCDMDVFEEGDEVLIEMQSQSWNEPLVVGFKSDPRPCALDFYFMIAGPRAQFAQSSSSGRIKPPAMDNPSGFSAQGLWPYFNHMCVHNGELCAWYTIGSYRLSIKGSTKIDVVGTGTPAVVATKNCIWSLHVETSLAPGDAGTVYINQFDADGSHLKQFALSNSAYYVYDCQGAAGMSETAIFSLQNLQASPGRTDFICKDDGTVTPRNIPGDFDTPTAGHGWGDQRVEVHQFGGISGRSVRLYNGVSTTGTTIITSDEMIDGCAMQQNYIVISTRSGKLICYDRKTLAPLATYQIPQSRGGMVTVDAARMPAAS